MAPLLACSSDSFLPLHFVLAANREHEAYNLTSCGVLATPPTIICKLEKYLMDQYQTFVINHLGMKYNTKKTHLCEIRHLGGNAIR